MRVSIMSKAVANTILEGFDKHYRLFREISAQAHRHFLQADWEAAKQAAISRIQMYDQRVEEAVRAVLERFPDAAKDEELWRQIKPIYIGLLYNHKQPELAETFYNSVACRVLHRRYYSNDFIFYRPAISTEHIEGEVPTYRSYYPSMGRRRRLLLKLITDFRFGQRFENLRRDLRYLLIALAPHIPQSNQLQPNFQIQLLSSPFYRNKAAYLVGRIINGHREQPFVIPVLQNEQRELYIDTILFDSEDLSTLFSFARAYFMVDMEVPSAYVDFLSAILPRKPRAELYTLLGLQKQGKTMFFRDLQHHLKHSTDAFTIAPGIKGMVMLVFTLPSFPYVFKIIKDVFEPPKEPNRQLVKDKYLLVKYHDRVGRLADTLEYSDVAFPLARIDPELLTELQTKAASSIELEGDYLIIRHLYIERRLTPLNLYLKDADEARRRAVIREYGNAIRELAGANIFPGDMLLKNFGVTRGGRVVFYDYDEICYMTECNFRRIPPPSSLEDEMLDHAWYSVGESDVFPEQFLNFAFPVERDRRLFLLYHQALIDPEFWLATQRSIEQGQQSDVFPYPEAMRFCQRLANSDQLPGRHRRAA